MCGIALVKRKKGASVAKIVAKRYQHQKSRGHEGFGYIAVEDGYVKGIVRAEKEEDILAKLKEETSNEILFHHRFPTSTPNFEQQTHPFAVKVESFEHDYYFIHNGVLNNHAMLKVEHDKMGIVYNSEYKKTKVETEKLVFADGHEAEKETTTTISTKYNDSEALAIELALYFEGQREELDLRGTVAFIGYQTDKEGKILKLHYGHNSGNPIVAEYVQTKNNKGKKSKKNKKKEQYNDMFVLKSAGNGIDVDEDTIYHVDYETGELSETVIDIGYSWKNNKPVQNAYNPNSRPRVGFQDRKELQAGESGTERAIRNATQEIFGRSGDSRANVNSEGHLEWPDEESMSYGYRGDDEAMLTIDEDLEREMHRHHFTKINKRIADIEEEIINEDADRNVWKEGLKTESNSLYARNLQTEIDDSQERIKDLDDEKRTLEGQLEELDGMVPSIMSDELEVIEA